MQVAGSRRNELALNTRGNKFRRVFFCAFSRATLSASMGISESSEGLPLTHVHDRDARSSRSTHLLTDAVNRKRPETLSGVLRSFFV